MVYIGFATMSKGKIVQTSPLMSIEGTITEVAVNTFIQREIELPLNPLSNEVFVVTDVEMRIDPPEIVAVTRTRTIGQITSRSQTAAVNFGDRDVIGHTRAYMDFTAVNPVYVPPQVSPRISTGDLTEDFVDIIATANFFIAVEGQGNAANLMQMDYKLTGFRANVSADVYASLLVQEISD